MIASDGSLYSVSFWLVALLWGALYYKTVQGKPVGAQARPAWPSFLHAVVGRDTR